jgi:hypothetical protein
MSDQNRDPGGRRARATFIGVERRGRSRQRRRGRLHGLVVVQFKNRAMKLSRPRTKQRKPCRNHCGGFQCRLQTNYTNIDIGRRPWVGKLKRP